MAFAEHGLLQPRTDRLVFVGRDAHGASWRSGSGARINFGLGNKWAPEEQSLPQSLPQDRAGFAEIEQVLLDTVGMKKARRQRNIA